MEKLDYEKTMDLDQWEVYFQNNPGLFWNILRKEVRKMRYTLEYGSELEDIMQSALEKMLEVFDRHGEILDLYKNTTFEFAARNAVNEHIRSVNKFKGQPGSGIPDFVPGEKIDPAFLDSGEVTAVSPDDYSMTDLGLDLEFVLDPKELKIVKLLFTGYTQKEAGELVGMAQQSIYHRLAKIRRKIKKAGLYEVLI